LLSGRETTLLAWRSNCFSISCRTRYLVFCSWNKS